MAVGGDRALKVSRIEKSKINRCFKKMPAESFEVFK